LKVKNLNGSAPITKESGNWLSHWEKLSGLNAFMCYVKGCIKRPSVGGQVQKDSPIDTTWYVIPLCDDCARKRGQDLDIWDAATLIPAAAHRATSTAASAAARVRAPRSEAVLA
jgi:hypothetical protein